MSLLIKETGAGLYNSNAFADVAEGDVYNGGSLYSDAWFNAGSDTVPAGGVKPEKGTVNLTNGMTLPIVIVFDDVKANADYEPYIYFSSSDALPEVFDWIVTSQTTTGMTIALSPSPSTNGSVLHWRVSTLIADADTVRDKKETALIMATRVINYNMEWNGYRASLAQALEWPRRFVKNRDYGGENVLGPDTILSANMPYGYTGYWPNNVIPNPIKDATCELALELLRKDRTVEVSQKGVTRFSLGQGAISADFDKADRPRALSEQVMMMLEPFGQARANRMVLRLEGV